MLFIYVSKHIIISELYNPFTQICPGPHAFLKKVSKIYITINQSYWVLVRNKHQSFLFRTVQFLEYIFNNSCILNRVLSIDVIIDSNNQDLCEKTIIGTYSKLWTKIPLHLYISPINSTIRQKGFQTLLPGIFGNEYVSLIAVGGIYSSTLVDSSLQFRPWARQNRKQKSDEEPWRPIWLLKTMTHSLRHCGAMWPCIFCTLYGNGRPTENVRSTWFSCGGCGAVSIYICPDQDKRSKSCFYCWYTVRNVNPWTLNLDLGPWFF